MLDSISIHMPEGRRKPCMKIQDLVSCSNFWAFSGACAIIPSKQIVPVLCGLLEYVKATYTILGCATSILFPSNHYSCEFSVHSRTRVDSPAYPGCGASCSLCHLVIIAIQQAQWCPKCLRQMAMQFGKSCKSDGRLIM